LRRFGGERLNQLSRWIGERGLSASIIVRLVPSAPFVIVNMCAGSSHIPYWKFLTGSAIGILPKTALIAFLGASVWDVLRSHEPGDIAMMVLAFAAWLALVVGVRLGVRHWAEGRGGDLPAPIRAKASSPETPSRRGDP
jgi:uncharacterized membrane protein YdjX (TVP38/TMEM64 family)